MQTGRAGFVDEFVEKEMIAILPRLTRFARSLTRSDDDASDLVQATCERAIANLDKWEAGTRLDSWMYRIAHNLCRNAHRDAASRGRKHDLIAASEPHAEDGEALALSRMEARTVGEAIDLLPVEQRTALLLVAAEGRSYAETAEITGCSVAAVTSRISRARDTLRQSIGSRT